MKKSVDWERGIKLATKYIKNFGWELQLINKNLSATNAAKKIIFLYSKHPPKIKYYVLLHEIGHMLDMSRILYVSPAKKHNKKYNTLTYKVERVKEEFDAWDYAYDLAKLNKWPLDYSFFAIRARFLSTYMIWANKKKYPGLKILSNL
jgi:hypothetical protein